MNTFEIEDKYSPSFSTKIKISVVRGKGIYFWDETGRKYIDFTSGWGVTCLGHASPVITKALLRQSKMIIQNPNSGATYSPYRAKLLEMMAGIMPHGLNKIFFSNSGAEANDAVIKLARKASGRLNVISTFMSFHGRTISTASATGQAVHRDKFNPLMPNYLFVNYNNIEDVKKIIRDNVAAVIVEPIQGEGGVIVPSENYLEQLSALCEENRAYLILDEIQTGFYRTGPLFASSPYKIKAGFLTMAKHIAGGFPFGAFAMRDDIAAKLETGDHGGTYCGNPLGCAVSYAVIEYMKKNNIEKHVNLISDYVFEYLKDLKKRFSDLITDVRGKGLLIALETDSDATAGIINDHALNNGLLLNVKHGRIIRIFPALNIKLKEIKKGLDIIGDAFVKIKKEI